MHMVDVQHNDAGPVELLSWSEVYDNFEFLINFRACTCCAEEFVGVRCAGLLPRETMLRLGRRQGRDCGGWCGISCGGDGAAALQTATMNVGGRQLFSEDEEGKAEKSMNLCCRGVSVQASSALCRLAATVQPRNRRRR